MHMCMAEDLVQTWANTLAVSLMKIGNDIRLLGSGPRWVL
jgi:fumarate hydratase class II